VSRREPLTEEQTLLYQQLRASRRFNRFIKDNYVVNRMMVGGEIAGLQVIESPKPVGPLPEPEQMLDLEKILKANGCLNVGNVVKEIIDLFCEPLPDRPADV
jgi:hypothetical protein